MTIWMLRYIRTYLYLPVGECDDCELKLPDKEWDEYHHKATRTLFVGNLEKDIEPEQLRDFFKHYGEILVSHIHTRR